MSGTHRVVRSSCVVMILALVLMACGDDGSKKPSSDTTSSSTRPDDSVSSPPSGPGPTDPGRPRRVVPRPGMVDVRPVAFDVEASRSTSKGVLVRYWTGVEPCYVLDHYDVVETDDVVTVTLFVGSDPESRDKACIELAVLAEVEVALSAPLGERTLVDGSVS